MNEPKSYNPFGLYPQIRTDFLEKKEFQIGKKIGEEKIDFFEFSKNNEWESHVEYFLNGLEEKNE